MGTKKLQGADGMNFQLQLTIKGLESINLPEENLTNESGNDIMKISCWGGKLSAYVNLPNAIRPNNVQPFQLSDCIKIELVRNQVIEHMRSYLQKHLKDMLNACVQEIFESLTCSTPRKEVSETLIKCKELIVDTEVLRKALKKWYVFKKQPDSSKRIVSFYREKNMGFPEDVLRTLKLMHNSLG